MVKDQVSTSVKAKNQNRKNIATNSIKILKNVSHQTNLKKEKKKNLVGKKLIPTFKEINFKAHSEGLN